MEGVAVAEAAVRGEAETEGVPAVREAAVNAVAVAAESLA